MTRSEEHEEHAVADYLRPLSKEYVNTLPLYRYDGAVLLIQTPAALAAALRRMRREWVLGLDTESRPNFQKGGSNHCPALVQIACSDVVYLIQLLETGIDDDLLALLEDPTILKAGVAIGDDMRQLARIRPFTAGGVVDIGVAARKHGLSTQGLRTLAANFLAGRISKGAQCSNWESKKLSPQQILYAATDAWVSRELFLRMDSLGLFHTEKT